MTVHNPRSKRAAQPLSLHLPWCVQGESNSLTYVGNVVCNQYTLDAWRKMPELNWRPEGRPD